MLKIRFHRQRFWDGMILLIRLNENKLVGILLASWWFKNVQIGDGWELQEGNCTTHTFALANNNQQLNWIVNTPFSILLLCIIWKCVNANIQFATGWCEVKALRSFLMPFWTMTTLTIICYHFYLCLPFCATKQNVPL